MPPADRPLTLLHVDAERGWSGGEVQVFLLLEGLRARGHRALLVCPPESRAHDEARRRELEVRPLELPGLGSPTGGGLRAVWGLARLGRELAPDLFHLHTGRAAWLGGLAARRAGVPAVVTRRMDRRVKRGWRTRLLYESLTRRVAAISPAVAECLREGGVPASRIELIPSAVDLPAPARERGEVRRAEGASEDACVLLSLAALVRRKGLDVLLEALAQLDEPGEGGHRPLLWIAGDGPERADLEARARSLGLASQVRFLGRRDDPADLLAACDVFVLPSRREGLGVAALEAMAAGRPVVASRVGGLGEAVVHEETGLLVTPEDPKTLADALARLLGDAALRDRLGAAGPARVGRAHGPEQMVASYVALYERVLAEAAS